MEQLTFVNQPKPIIVPRRKKQRKKKKKKPKEKRKQETAREACCRLSGQVGFRFRLYKI
jgi:hypothetical protein